MASNQGNPNRGLGRGFASMDVDKQRKIASQGGRAAHQRGTAHEFTSEEARIAGRKGGEAVSQDREHMAEIGRKGGEARGNSRVSSPCNPDMRIESNDRSSSNESGTEANRPQ